QSAFFEITFCIINERRCQPEHRCTNKRLLLCFLFCFCLVFEPKHSADRKHRIPKDICEMTFNPATSTIDGIITISLVPTYGCVFPEASVDTITFGTPIGKARIAGVTIDVPPEPPNERTPSNLPCSYSSGSTYSIPLANPAVASPLSFLADNSSMSLPNATATTMLVICASDAGPNPPVLIVNVLRPSDSSNSLAYKRSFALESHVSVNAIVFGMSRSPSAVSLVNCTYSS